MEFLCKNVKDQPQSLRLDLDLNPWFLQRVNDSVPPVVPFSPPFFGEGSPAKIDYRQETSGTRILTSLLEDPDEVSPYLISRQPGSTSLPYIAEVPAAAQPAGRAAALYPGEPREIWELGNGSTQANLRSTRSPSSALLFQLFWGEGSPTKINYGRKKVPLF